MKAKSERTADITTLGTHPALGPLEAQVMEIVWERGEVAVRDVHDILRKKRDLAYTTVMTVMHNLHRKGLLDQRSEGQAHIYTARQSRTDFVRSKVGEVLDQLLENFTEPALAHFINRLRTADAKKLAELERLIAEQRAREEGEDDA